MWQVDRVTRLLKGPCKRRQLDRLLRRRRQALQQDTLLWTPGAAAMALKPAVGLALSGSADALEVMTLTLALLQPLQQSSLSSSGSSA